jgi:mannose-6-phosphate isomerase-like protein (cupin superfamily)
MVRAGSVPGPLVWAIHGHFAMWGCSSAVRSIGFGAEVRGGGAGGQWSELTRLNQRRHPLVSLMGTRYIVGRAGVLMSPDGLDSRAAKEIAMAEAKDVQGTYLHFRDGGRADAVDVSKSFWADVAAGKHPELDDGRLMTAFTFSEPWSTWERHPAGEELVMLLSGAARVVLEESGEERSVALNRPGSYVLVPPNVWHTARTSMPTTLLFLTPGAGTEHRPVRD